VLGTGNPSRISKAIEALDMPLSREQWFEIWQASTGRDVP
jgi:predicted oxidoreductase